METRCRRNKQRRKRSARSTQQKESELRNSRSCHICLKKQAEKNAACTVNSAERVWDEELENMPHLPEEQIKQGKIIHLSMWRQVQPSTCRFIRYFFKSKSISYHQSCNHSDGEFVLTLKFLGRLTRRCGLHVPIHHPWIKSLKTKSPTGRRAHQSWRSYRWPNCSGVD